MRYKIIIKIIISFIFIAYIVFKINLGLLAETVSSVRLKYYFISLVILMINSVVLAQKYKIVMQSSGIYQPLTELVKINFICRFYSMFLTTAVGQSVIRWHLSTKHQEGRQGRLRRLRGQCRPVPAQASRRPASGRPAHAAPRRPDRPVEAIARPSPHCRRSVRDGSKGRRGRAVDGCQP